MAVSSTAVDEVIADSSAAALNYLPIKDTEVTISNEGSTLPFFVNTESKTQNKLPANLQSDYARTLDLVPKPDFDERSIIKPSRKPDAMVNIPEHEDSSLGTKIMHLPPLPSYISSGNYLTNANMDLQTRFTSPLNSLGFFNSSELSQYNLQTVMNLPMATTDNPLIPTAWLKNQPLNLEPARVSAYAKLIFEDGYFYMNTYSVILGRDLKAWHAAIRKEKRRQKQIQEGGDKIGDSDTPIRVKHDAHCYSRSIVSESGGMLRAGNDSDNDGRARLRKLRKMNKASEKSKSTDSSSPSLKKVSAVHPNKVKVYEAQNLQSTILPIDEPVPVDPASFRPSPHDCPLVAIHPPATAPITVYKSISREHVKIAFNSRKCYFEAHVIGRNGCFVQDQWYHTNEVVPLKSGDFLQVGGITVQFMLPNLLDPTTVEYENSSDAPAHENSLDVESDQQHSDRQPEISEEESDSSMDQEALLNGDIDHFCHEKEVKLLTDIDRFKIRKKKKKHGTQQKNSIDQDKNIVEDQKAKSKITLCLKLDHKRGPGRPPKNGILSKREQKLLQKKDDQIFNEALNKEDIENIRDKAKKKIKIKGLDLETDSKAKEGLIDGKLENPVESLIETSDPYQPLVSLKNKVGRPRKHPLPDNYNEPPREKRKYTKRKPKEPRELKDGEVNECGSGEEKRVKKEKAPSKPPRSPSPVMNEEDYTPEQLAKPQANYVTLIHEALSNAPTQQLGLPDIYRAIYRKYPYFRFKTQTLGWQSSVRHNLSQHHAFRKVEKDGKGWTWGIVDGISIEKEKKRRATPPPQSYLGLQQTPYQNGLSKIAGHFTYRAPMESSHNQLGHFSNYQLPPRINGQVPSVINPSSNFPPSIPLNLAAPFVPTSYHSPYAPRQTSIDTCTQSADQSNEAQNQTSCNNVSSTIKFQPGINSQREEFKLKEEKTPPQDISAGEMAQAIDHSNLSLGHLSRDQSHQAQGSQSKESPFGSNNTYKQSLPTPSNQQTPQNTTSSQGLNHLSTSVTPSNVQLNEDVIRAAEAFKKNLLESLKSKQSQMIVNSAVNRVLGISSPNDISSNPQEEMIVATLRSLLSKIPGYNNEADIKCSTSYKINTQLPDVIHSSHQSSVQNAQSNNKLIDNDGSIVAVARPPFTSQGLNRPSNAVIHRPSMISATPKTAIHSETPCQDHLHLIDNS